MKETRRIVCILAEHQDDVTGAQNYDSISFYILHFAMLGSNLRWSVQLQPDPMQKLCTCKNPQLGSALLIDVITHFSDSGTRDLDWILKPKFPYKSQRDSCRAVSRAQPLPGPSQWWSIGAELPRPGLGQLFLFIIWDFFQLCQRYLTDNCRFIVEGLP